MYMGVMALLASPLNATNLGTEPVFSEAKDRFVMAWVAFGIFCVTSMISAWVAWTIRENFGSRDWRARKLFSCWMESQALMVAVDALCAGCAFVSFAYAMGEPFITTQRLAGATEWDARVAVTILIIVHIAAVFVGVYRGMSRKSKRRGNRSGLAVIEHVIDEVLTLAGVVGSWKPPSRVMKESPGALEPDQLRDARKCLVAAQNLVAPLGETLLRLGINPREMQDALTFVLNNVNLYLNIGGKWIQDENAPWVWRWQNPSDCSKKDVMDKVYAMLCVLRRLEKAVEGHHSVRRRQENVRIEIEGRELFLLGLSIPGEMA